MMALYIQVVPPPTPPPPPPGLSLSENLIVLMFGAIMYAIYILRLKGRVINANKT
ncbi:hypothetical protein [Polaribacter septentrionalilitoris]|uniref:hypothetical protein n=1 Tax=Polaribacter septentrionalilitoris TaxID=2494657 RepID=UPI0013572D90|nr:hypothetical protein [Polaribacter septentrionalilitoris]